MKIKKRIIVLLAAITMLCTQMIPAMAESKKDTPDSRSHITYLENGDYIKTTKGGN